MNKICITVTIIIIITLVIGVTTYKVVDKHNDKLMEVEEKYIIETAKKCLNEKKCSGSKITLQTLYDLEFLEISNYVLEHDLNVEKKKLKEIQKK